MAPASEPVFFDAGLFIAALLAGDPRHAEARPIVEAARAGQGQAITDASILSEVYGALTWEQADPRHEPQEAAEAVRALVAPPSAIRVLAATHEAALRALELASAHGLTARRIHDARHAAVALAHRVSAVYTYDVGDWSVFEADGLRIVGPRSALRRLGRPV
jgi:predicted nucleic acid-binding protein